MIGGSAEGFIDSLSAYVELEGLLSGECLAALFCHGVLSFQKFMIRQG